MLRNILLISASLLAASASIGNAQTRFGRILEDGTVQPISLPPVGAPLVKVREYPPAAAFEYEVLNKGRSSKKDVYMAMWTHALAVCDEQNGYVTEYHSGTKHLSFLTDTREGAFRERANATCFLDAAPPQPAVAATTPAIAVSGDATSPGRQGTIVATGEKRQAYEAAREKAFQVCLDQDRPVDRLSVGFDEDPRRKLQVIFTCAARKLGG
jgi:hypothetical protein